MPKIIFNKQQKAIQMKLEHDIYNGMKNKYLNFKEIKIRGYFNAHGKVPDEDNIEQLIKEFNIVTTWNGAKTIEICTADKRQTERHQFAILVKDRRLASPESSILIKQPSAPPAP